MRLDQLPALQQDILAQQKSHLATRWPLVQVTFRLGKSHDGAACWINSSRTPYTIYLDEQIWSVDRPVPPPIPWRLPSGSFGLLPGEILAAKYGLAWALRHDVGHVIMYWLRDHGHDLTRCVHIATAARLSRYAWENRTDRAEIVAECYAALRWQTDPELNTVAPDLKAFDKCLRASNQKTQIKRPLS